MNDPERREWGEPDREDRDRDTNMTWALGLSVLALGAALVPTGGLVFLLVGAFLAIAAMASLTKSLDRSPIHRRVALPPGGEDRRSAPSLPISKERELLSALRDSGSITPVEAVIETSLTVREADRMLSELAGGGHLAVESRNGALFYSLPGRSNPELENRE